MAEIKKPMSLPKTIKNENDLIMQGDPEKQLEFGKKCASALMMVVKNKPKKVIINGEQYLEFEDWQTLARFFGITVGVEWTKPIERNGKIVGYEARAAAIRNNEPISSAEAMCLRTEKIWANRDEFSLRSMAQTRACAKALRNVLAWVAVLAGFKATPAEEIMTEAISEDNKCSECGVPVNDKVYSYSFSSYGRALCITCQKNKKS